MGPFPPGSPDDPNNWRAGTYRVAVVVRRAGQDERVSNELPLALAPRLMKDNGVTNGFRTVINTGADGGQEVYHVHMHVYGGPRPWRPSRG